MQIRFHPFRPGEYPARTTHRKSDQFSSPWSRTLQLLEKELAKLGAHEVVIQIGIGAEEIRIDGWPRANARPTHPGVIISFDSKHGPLRYLTDEYHDWQANIRAIALGLQALRAVDRYGITRRGEQYTGWKALSSGSGITTRRQAAVVVSEFSDAGEDPDDIIDDEEIRDRAIRAALRAAHPDGGGSTEQFQRVQEARRLLTG